MDTEERALWKSDAERYAGESYSAWPNRVLALLDEVDRLTQALEAAAAEARREWETQAATIRLLDEKRQRAEADYHRGLMETQHITPTCRTNRTTDGAWDEAVRRLREIYDAQIEHDPTLTIALDIWRQT